MNKYQYGLFIVILMFLGLLGDYLLFGKYVFEYNVGFLIGFIFMLLIGAFYKDEFSNNRKIEVIENVK